MFKIVPSATSLRLPFTDLLFLESSEVLFRVSLALLEEHQDQLLTRNSFEGIMEYFKVKLYISFFY